MVIYFGKLNLNSNHIFQVYRKELELRNVLNAVHISLKAGINYEKEEVFKDGLETKISTTTYRLAIKHKSDDFIEGYIYKDAKIYYKQFNESNNVLEWKHVDCNEVAVFYFDIYNELVGYVTAARFGYREFLEAFQGIINNCLCEAKYGYRFTLDLLTTGFKISEIEEELRLIGNIKELKFKIQPPNLQDDLLNSLEKDIEEVIANLEEGNISTKSIILTSSSSQGLNIDSREIREQLEQIGNMHSKISIDQLTKHGYVEVEVTDQHGYRIATGDEKAVKKEIDKLIDFKAACESVFIKRRLKRSDS